MKIVLKEYPRFKSYDISLPIQNKDIKVIEKMSLKNAKK